MTSRKKCVVENGNFQEYLDPQVEWVYVGEECWGIQDFAWIKTFGEERLWEGIENTALDQWMKHMEIYYHLLGHDNNKEAYLLVNK